MLKDKSILYIVHNFNSFQKDPIEEASKSFKKVYVLVRYKPLSRFVKYLPISILKRFDESFVLDLNGLPENVEVIKTPVLYLPFGLFNRFLGLLHYKAVQNQIRKHNIRFDVIHAHFAWSSGYVGMRLKEKYHVPLVITGHGYDVYDLPFRSDFWNRSIKSILDKADKVITVSNYNKGYLKRLGIDDNKIQIIHNGYYERLFKKMDKQKARKDLGIKTSGKICLCVGNLEKIKGQDFLIRSIHGMLSSNSEIKCYIVGGGSMENYLKKLVKSFGLEQKIILTGPIPHAMIAQWISAADLFIIPSLRESASVVLLEALACGVPVVATDVGIVSEVIDSSEIGYVSKPGDMKSLGENIEKALFKKWDSSKIQSRSKEYTWDNSVNKTLSIYKELLSK